MSSIIFLIKCGANFVKAEYSKKIKEGEALRCKIGPTFYQKNNA
jgi:hypothetical protein